MTPCCMPAAHHEQGTLYPCLHASNPECREDRDSGGLGQVARSVRHPYHRQERDSKGDRVPDETDASEVEHVVEEVDVSWLDDHVELDLTANGRVTANGEAADPPVSRGSSERAGDLASDHWRERAVLWRERAIAAELVAKMLQRNLDDLHATLEDLRREAKAVATAQE